MKAILVALFISIPLLSAFATESSERIPFRAIVYSADFNLSRGCELTLQSIQFEDKIPGTPILDQVFHYGIQGPISNGHECAFETGDVIEGFLILGNGQIRFENF